MPWDMSPLVGLGTFEGHAAIRRFWEDWYTSYEELEIEPEEVTLAADELIDVGDGVLVLATARGRGRGSGVETETKFAHAWAMRDGKGRRIAAYLDRAAALKAVGLEE